MPNFAFIITAIAAVLGSPILTLVAQEAPQAGEIALIIAKPWGVDAVQIAKMSDLSEVAPQSAPMGALVTLENAQSIRQLYANGAWLVVDGKRILELCVN